MYFGTRVREHDNTHARQEMTWTRDREVDEKKLGKDADEEMRSASDERGMCVRVCVREGGCRVRGAAKGERERSSQTLQRYH